MNPHRNYLEITTKRYIYYICYFCILFLFSSYQSQGVPLAVDSMSDENFELSFEQAYQTYTHQSDFRGEKLHSSSQNRVYQIQSNDTMWDISRTFFGDGFFWPHLWAKNGTITNPHEITPGEELAFFTGDKDSPPSVEVVSRSALPKNTQQDKAPIPPPAAIYTPLLRNLPSSLPQWQGLREKQIREDKTGVTIEKLKIVKKEPLSFVTNYYVSETPAIAGTVSELEDDFTMKGKTIFFTSEMNFDPGYQLIIVRLIDSENSSGKIVGVVGEIKVLNLTNEDDLYRAKIEKVFAPILVGDLVIDEPLKIMDYSTKGKVEEIHATIIGGQFDSQRSTLGTGDLVFLDKGNKQGLEKGYLLSIVENRRVRVPDSLVDRGVRVIGQLKIVSVASNVATAIILQATEAILIGDYTGRLDTSEK